MRRVVLSILAGVLLATSASCYGPFRLTKKIHAWNGTLGNDIVEEIVFLAFVIIPVYGVCGFLDGVVLNTIEYWTGNVLIGAADAPVPGEERRFAGADGSESVVTYLGEGRVRLEERGVVRVIERTDDGFRLLDANGAELHRAVKTDGGLVVTDGARTLATLDATALEAGVAGGTDGAIGLALGAAAGAHAAP